MTISEGYGIYMGNLTREWERREVTSQGETKVIYSNALAYQPKKDDPTTFVDLTVWPDNNGSTAEGEAIAASTSKGTKVMVRGKFQVNSYVTREGQPKQGWKCNTWQVGAVIRAPRNAGAGAVADAFPGATQMSPEHEPF
jgi:single-stranded DNA-binding protein